MQRRSIHSAQMSHAAVGKLVLLTQHNYSQKLSIWCDCKPWSFCWENLQIHAPPVPRTHFFPSVFPTVSIHMLLSEISPPILFCWTNILLNNWYLTDDMFASCKSWNPTSQITIQDFHRPISALQLPITWCNAESLFAQRSWIWVCELKNFNRLSLFHIRMDSGTYTRRTFGTASTLGYVVKEAMTLQSRCYFGLQNVRLFLDAIASCSTYPCQWVSEW